MKNNKAENVLSNITFLFREKVHYSMAKKNSYISTENMISNRGGISVISSLPETGSVSVYKKYDILVSNIRPYFKKIWLAKDDGTCSGDVLVFRAKKVDPRFLYFILSDDNFFDYVMLGSKGTKMPRGDKQQIMKYPLPSLPPLDEQKRIAGVLGAFDDKIELLQKQNKTLEDMAKAIFKSWFVDFDIVKAKQRGEDKQKIMAEYKITEEIYNLFPSSFTDSVFGPIPSGWEVKSLGDISKISAGKRPQETTDMKTEQNQIPVYGGNGIKWYTNNPLFTSQIIITGRVGTLGEIYRISNPCWISDNALVFNTDPVNFEFLYNILLLINFESYNRGSTQPLITQSDINLIEIPFNVKEVKLFHDMVNYLYEKIDINNKQIQTLTETRDSLLPRLISGKLRV